MTHTDWVGMAAGMLMTVGMVPQVVRVLERKSAHDISMIYIVTLLAGMALWLSYGLQLWLWPVIYWNAIGLVLGVIILIAKLRWGM